MTKILNHPTDSADTFPSSGKIANQMVLVGPRESPWTSSERRVVLAG